MRTRNILLLTALGAAAAALLLSRTEKGKQITKDLANNAGQLRDRLMKLAQKTKDDALALGENGLAEARKFAKNSREAV